MSGPILKPPDDHKSKHRESLLNSLSSNYNEDGPTGISPTISLPVSHRESLEYYLPCNPSMDGLHQLTNSQQIRTSQRENGPTENILGGSMGYLRNNIDTLRFCHQNVGSIYSAERKATLSLLLDYTKEMDMDVIGLTESWLNGRDAHRLQSSEGIRGIYKIRSSDGPNDPGNGAIKGRGALILIKEGLARHIQESRRIPGRAIAIKLAFAASTLAIICLYAPTDPEGTGKEETIQISATIANWIAKYQGDGTKVIVMGDLNFCAQTHLDRLGAGIATSMPILRQALLNQGLKDVWREHHPNKIQFSHRTGTLNGYSEARLDYFYACDRILDACTGSAIGIDDFGIDSHHYPIFMEIRKIGILEQFQLVGPEPRLVFNLKETTKDQWEEFRNLTRDIPTALQLDPDKDVAGLEINIIWEELVNHLLEVGKSTLKWTMKGPRLSKRNLTKYEQATKWTHEIVRLAKHNRPRNMEKIRYRLEKLPALIDEEVPIHIDSGWRDYVEFLKIVRKIANKDNLREHESTIKGHINNRMIQLTKHQGKMIESLYDRTRLTADISFVKMGDHFISDPLIVKQEVKRYFNEWFAARIPGDLVNDTNWSEFYRPLDHIDPSIYDTLLLPPSSNEVKGTIRSLSIGKSAGPSGLPCEFFIRMDDSLLIILEKILGAILRTGQLPAAWKKASIFPISKKGDYDGDLGNLRPITLIDTGRKMFSSLLTTRLSKIMHRHQVLKGLNFGGAEGQQGLDAVHILQTCIDDATIVGKQLQILSLDIKRAYDSVPHQSLEASLQRLKLPQSYIDMIMDISVDRSVQVITKYGLTDSFQPACGIEQGEINAPLLWRIFYDPLLVKLSQCQEGYEISCHKRPKLKLNTLDANLLQDMTISCSSEELHTPTRLTINNVAFMDDLTLLSKNIQSLSVLLGIVVSFMTIHSIELNGTKTVLARKGQPATEDAILINGQPIGTVYDKGEPFRVLGVMLSTANLHKAQKEDMVMLSKQSVKILSPKVMTDKICGYIYKTVFLPKLCYMASGLCVNSSWAEEIERPWRALLKRKAGLPMSISNSVLFAKYGYGLPKVMDSIDNQEITNFMVWLNSPGLVGKITRLFFLRIQQEFNFPAFPCHTPQDCSQRKESKYSYIIKRLKIRNLRIGTDNSSYVPSPILHQRDKYISEVVPPEVWKIANLGLEKLSLFYLSQLRSNTGLNIRPWRDLGGTRKCPPKWFISLNRFLTDSFGTLKQEFRGPASFSRSANQGEPLPTISEKSFAVMYDNKECPPNMTDNSTIIWTDGSLDVTRTKAGCAAISESTSTSASFTRSHQMSSTTSELGAILLAVQACPRECKLMIMTDSQASIAKVDLENRAEFTRNILRDPDHEIIDSIHSLLAHKNVSLKTSWIKGHAGNHMNEAADRLANEARIEGSPPLNISSQTQIQFFLFSGIHKLHSYPRKALKHLAGIAHNFCLVSSSHGAQLRLPPSHLEPTIRALRSCEKKEPRLFTSLANSTARAFRFKLVTGLLPLGTRMKKWRIRANLSGQCRRCNQGEEDLKHLLVCEQAHEARNNVPERLKTMMKRLETEEDKEFGFVAEALIASGYDIQNFTGILDEGLATILKSIPFTISFSKAATATLKALWTIVYEDFWKPRCQETIDAERSLHISKEDKRSYEPRQQTAPPVLSTAHKFGISAARDQLIWTLAG